MRLNVKTLKLEDELAKFLAMISTELDLLNDKMKERGDNQNRKDIMEQMVGLTKCFEAATRSKLAIEKARTKKEASMTPEEELEEIKAYLMEFDPRDCLGVITALISHHNKKCMSSKKTQFIFREMSGVAGDVTGGSSV